MSNYDIIKTLNLSKEKRRDFNKFLKSIGNNGNNGNNGDGGDNGNNGDNENNVGNGTEIIYHNVVPTTFHVDDNPQLAYQYFEKIYKYYKSIEKLREEYPNGIIDNHYTDIYIYSTFAEQFFVTAIGLDDEEIKLYRIIDFSKKTKPDSEDETEYNCFTISSIEQPFGYDAMGIMVNLYEDGTIYLEFNS